LEKEKNNKGRIIDGQWVFGGLCRETKEYFAVEVEKRDSQTLLQIIKEKIHEQSVIISDCWKAYDCLQDEGFKHLKVNHKYNFVDPDTGAHTNTVERNWRTLKEKVPQCGRRSCHFGGYLAKAAFQLQHPEANKRMHPFLLAVAQLFPPDK